MSHLRWFYFLIRKSAFSIKTISCESIVRRRRSRWITEAGKKKKASALGSIQIAKQRKKSKWFWAKDKTCRCRSSSLVVIGVALRGRVAM